MRSNNGTPDHRSPNDEEIVLNAEHIIFAERIAAARPAYTNVTLTGDVRLSIRETLDELKGLSE
jgi:hypothetical protein